MTVMVSHLLAIAIASIGIHASDVHINRSECYGIDFPIFDGKANEPSHRIFCRPVEFERERSVVLDRAAVECVRHTP